MKKHFLQLLVLGLVILIGCQKEVTFESAGGSSKGSLQAVSGDCFPKTVNGVYSPGTALNATNTITVQVNVTRAGTYTVFSDTVNGFSFRATGTFTASGGTSVTLLGSGTPAVADTSDFIIRYDSSQCKVSVIIAAPAAGTLNCTGATVNGTYTKNVALTAANTVQIQANVTTPGAYSITTDTVRGIWFSTSGNFPTATTTPVTLTGHGTPDSAGTWTYRARFGSSNCTFTVTVANPAGAGAGTLGGNPNACTPIAVNGTYTQGTALGAGHNAQVQVNITTAGSVTITTDTVANFYFAFTGNLPLGAAQTVTLQGAGNPNSTGVKTFTVKFGTSRCTFTVNVGAPVPQDLFPLSANSWWSYDNIDGILADPGDSLTRVNVGSISQAGNTYRIFENKTNTVTMDSTLYRKSGSDYIERQWVDYYTAVFAFDVEQMGDILFLKDNPTLNQTWESQAFTGQFQGSPAWLKYTFQCTAVNTTATINGKNFSNVYKVAWRPKISFDGTNYQDEFISLESWYARGIGMIYLKIIDLSGGQGPYDINIMNWVVF